MEELIPRLRTFIESEMRSCAMDFAGITLGICSAYVGCFESFNEIKVALNQIKKN